METILVVDDEPMILELLTTILRTAGFAVLTASSGASALSIARLHRRDIRLLVTDVAMPGMDGATLARLLAEDTPDLPVLYMSGTYDGSQFERGERSRFLAKPFSANDLLAEVKALMAQPSVVTAGLA
jgi:two-component system OmpR family response regulator